MLGCPAASLTPLTLHPPWAELAALSIPGAGSGPIQVSFHQGAPLGALDIEALDAEQVPMLHAKGSLFPSPPVGLSGGVGEREINAPL